MKEAREEYYRRVIRVLKRELTASNTLEAVNILAVQIYYHTLKNDCDQEPVHEIADRICVARKFRCLAKPGVTRRFCYSFMPSLPCLNNLQGESS